MLFISVVLAYEPENKLIKEYRKTLRDYIEHGNHLCCILYVSVSPLFTKQLTCFLHSEMHEEKVNDISDEEDDSDDNEGNEENDSDDNSEGSEDGSSALSSALSANVNCRK